VDISEKLPKDYFEEIPLVEELEEESLYNQFEPLGNNEVESIYEVSPNAEEEIVSNNVAPIIRQNNVEQKDAAPAYMEESEEQEVVTDKNFIQNNVESNNDLVLEKIKKIDEKLFDLEKSLYDPASTSPTTLDKIEEVYNNFFKDEMVTRDFTNPVKDTNIDNSVIVNKEEVNPDYVKNDSLLSQESFLSNVNNDNSEDIIEINNNKQEDYKNSINNEIVKLNNERTELIKNLNLSKSLNKQNNQYNNKSSFIPNFQYNSVDQDDSIKESILTEQIFNQGDDVKMVRDSKGSPAIISKDQIDLRKAIKEHGGVKDAVSDSADKQSFVREALGSSSNYNNSSTSFFNNTENSRNQDISNSIDPNSFDQITKNTLNTVIAIKELTKHITSLSNTLNKNFNGLNGSLKDLKSSQNNIVNNINSNKNYSSSNENSSMGSGGQQQGNIIPNVRGNTPLSTDLPEGMVMRGSNLTNRFNE
jgi:hypothetical protein